MKFKILSLIIASSLAMAACGNNDNKTEDKTNETSTEQTTESTDTAKDNNSQSMDARTFNLVDVNTSPTDAIATAQKEAAGDLESISLERKGSDLVYEISLHDGTNQNEVKVDDATNKVIKKKTEKDTTDGTFKYSDAVPVDEAFDAAKAEYDGQLNEWKLDYDDNKLQYQFDIVNDKGLNAEVTVDAKTKDIIEVDED